MDPEHDGQESGEPVLSLAIRFSACAGLYVTGRGLRICPSSNIEQPRITMAPVRLELLTF